VIDYHLTVSNLVNVLVVAYKVFGKPGLSTLRLRLFRPYPSTLLKDHLTVL